MPKTNLKLVFLVFLLFNTPVFAQQRVRLVDYINQIEKQYDLRFSYKDSDLLSQTILIPKNDLSLPEILNYLRSKTPFDYTVLDEQNIAIIAKTKTPDSICGRLMDRSGEPISEASIADLERNNSTISDKDGYFNLNGIDPNSILTISHLGYGEKPMAAAFFIQNKPCKTIYLEPKTEILEEVVVQNVLTSGIDIKSDGSVAIKTRQYGMLPGLIEPDVLQIVQRLPGIESINETVSSINIRGGTNDQNLILWDGIKMYQTGHFFGLISSINPYLTEEINVYKNGVSAQYGDGVSGMLDFKTIEKIPTKIKGGAGINLINADGFLQIPFSKKIGLQVSGRRSLNDFFSTPTYNEYFDRAFQDSKITTKNRLSANENFSSDENFIFYDVNAKLIFDFGARAKFSVNFFNLANTLSFRETIRSNSGDDNDDDENQTRTSRLEQDNLAIGVDGKIKLNNRLNLHLNSYYTNYNLKAVNFDLLTDQRLDQKNEVLETEAKFVFEYLLNDQFSFRSGYEYIETGVTNIQLVNNPFFSSNIKNVLTEHSGFLEAELKSGFGTKITSGGRVSYIEDLDEWIFEPRINIYQKLTPAFSLQLMGELKHQTTTQTIDLQEDFLGVEKRRWTLADGENFPLIHSRQASAGINYSQNDWLVSLTGFIKAVDEILTSNQGFQDQLEFKRLEGKYEVKGVELLIDKKIKNFSFSGSYAYKDNQIIFDSLTPSRIPNNQDIKHSMSLVSSYKYKNLKVALGYQWRTGKPFTEPNPDAPINNPGAFESINYQSPNSSTLPDFSRVDFSTDYQFMLGNVRAVAGLSVLNVFDRTNILNTYYVIEQNNGVSNVRRVNNISLGITPNASFRVFF